MYSPKKGYRHIPIKMLSQFKIFNEVESQKILIFDFRTREEFQTGCLLDYSINLPYNEIPTELLENSRAIEDKLLEPYADSGTCNRVQKYKRCFVVLIMSEEKIPKKAILEASQVMDNPDESLPQRITIPLKFYKNLVNNKVREIGLYNRGFRTLKSNFPFLCYQNNLPALFMYFA